MRLRQLGVLCCFAISLGACSTVPEQTENTNNIREETTIEDFRDPFESVNRSLWIFNWEYLDHYILRPTTVGYTTVTPGFVRTGLKNVISNLDEPAVFLNSILQAKWTDAGVTTGRFALNTSLGLLGLFDVATDLGIEKRDEDFSQTLAVWGVGDGPYLMIPGMGPSTVADTSGRIVDNLYFPMTLLNTPQSILKFVVSGLEGRAELMQAEDLIYHSVDSYAFVKEGYYQRQAFKDYDGDVPEKEIDDEEEALLESFLEEEFD